MKIVYFTKPSFGDCDFPLIKALIAQGHDVITLIHMPPYFMHTTIFDIQAQKNKNEIYPASEFSELKKFQNYIPLQNVYIANDTVGKNNLKSFPLFMRELYFICKHKPDIVHYVEDPFPFHILPLWFFSKKLVLTIHDGKPHTGADNSRSRFTRKAIKLFVRKFILLNKKEVDVFSKEYGIKKEYLFTSHLGYYEMLRLDAKSSLEKQNQILFFGQISKYKGVEYLIQAMKIVHEQHPETKLLIAGKANYNIDFSDCENADYIEIRNAFIEQDKLANLIGSSLVTVCPYTDATQSGVVNSSFALYTPVIATNVGALPEMIENGKTGIIVPPKDVNALADAIITVLDDPNTLVEMSECIKANEISGKGSWDEVAREYTDIYKA